MRRVLQMLQVALDESLSRAGTCTSAVGDEAGVLPGSPLISSLTLLKTVPTASFARK